MQLNGFRKLIKYLIVINRMVIGMNNNKLMSWIIFILFFTGTIFPFNIDNFLYPSENKTMVSYENFTQNSITYSIIKISNKETILLKTGKEMTNESEIASVLKTYYKSKYYPTQVEIDNITNLIKLYNQSRTDGDAKEEQFCMGAQLKVDGTIIVEGKKKLECVDNASCNFAAQLVYTKWYSGAFESWQKYLSHMKPFATASYGTTAIVNTSLYMIENSNEETLYNAISYLKNAIPNLSKYKSDIETSVFRSPNKGESCKIDKCNGICPPIDLNDTAFTMLNNSVNALESKLAPFAKYKNISGYVSNSTQVRIAFYTGENKADYYDSIFEPLREKENKSIEKANELSKSIINNSLKVKIEILSQMGNKINKSITDRNFTTIDADLEEYSTLISSTTAAIESTESVYTQSLNASKNIAIQILILESKEIGGDDASLFQDLVNKSKRMDEKLKTANLTVEDHAAIVANYSEVAGALNGIETRQKENAITTVMSNFKAATYKTGDSLFDAVKSSNIIPEKDLASNKWYFTVGFSILTFLSLSSIIVLIISIRIIRKNVTTMRMVMYAIGSLAVIIFFLIFSILIYYYLDKATVTSDISVWLNEFWNSGKNLSVIINVKNLSDDNVNSMKGCALLIASAFEEKATLGGANKTVSMYEFADNCSIGLNGDTLNATLNKTECFKIMGNDEIVYVDYSSNETRINFPSLIEKQILAVGDAKWHKTCIIAGVLTSSW